MNDNTLHWLALGHAPGIGPGTADRLLKACGSIERLFADPAGLHAHGLSTRSLEFLRRPDAGAWARDLEWLQQPQHHLITRDHPAWPTQLDSLAQPPVMLYLAGDPEYLARPQLAMVGSRHPTASGERTATEFARHLSRCGITITSGLALGIDGAAHRGALEGIAGTVALVAHGLDRVYPARHRELAERISAQGALVSEMPIGTEPRRGLFPRRNRLISGLAVGTLVVEAAVRSGSLITAKFALEQGREVFAIPGSIHNPMARGCHQLIRQGAKLVETADDILEELARSISVEKPQDTVPRDSQLPNMTLDPDYQKLLKCLQFEPAAIDELAQCSGFSAAEVASMLLILELEGNVVCDAGRYSRTC